MARSQAPALRGSEDDVRRALDACESPFYIWGPDGTVWLSNPAFAKLAGRPAEQVRGMRVSDLLAGEDGRTDQVRLAMDALKSGAIREANGRRTVRRPTGALVPVWAWSRAVTVAKRRGVVSLVVPANELGLAGRDPVAPWRSLATVVVGVADDRWRIQEISKDAGDLSDLCKGLVFSGTSLRDLVESSDGGDASAGRVLPLRTRRQAHAGSAEPWAPALTDWLGEPVEGRLRCPDGRSVEVQLIYGRVPAHGEPNARSPQDRILFALIGSVDPRVATERSARVRELELRLRRIGAEVRAAHIMEDVAGSPAVMDHSELADLTTRQWGILSRLVRGERVPQIAADLYLSQSTVRNHLSAIFEKFGVHSQGELLASLRPSDADAGAG